MSECPTKFNPEDLVVPEIPVGQNMTIAGIDGRVIPDGCPETTLQIDDIGPTGSIKGWRLVTGRIRTCGNKRGIDETRIAPMAAKDSPFNKLNYRRKLNPVAVVNHKAWPAAELNHVSGKSRGIAANRMRIADLALHG